MDPSVQNFEFSEFDGAEKKEPPLFSLNYKRVLARIGKYWYVMLITLILALAAAYFVNRYSTRIYPVSASIIIKEGEENVGAQFLYNNALVNPYRNFYNELYILKSYPLMQEVVEELNFTVSFYREGNIKTTEYYDKDFPVAFTVLQGSSMPWGKSFGFQLQDDATFLFEYLSEDGAVEGKQFNNLPLDDTVQVNGYRFLTQVTGKISDDLIDKYFVARFTDPFTLAKRYSGKLAATWAQQGASVVNLDINGTVPQKEMDFLNKFIEKYQEYDVNKKSRAATKSITFLDEQLQITGDSLQYYENQVLAFKKTNLSGDISQESTRLYEKLRELEARNVAMILQESYFQYLSDFLKKDDMAAHAMVTPSSVDITDPVLVSLIGELIAVTTELRVSSEGTSLLKDNPLYKEKERRMVQLKKAIVEGIENYKKTQNISQGFINDQISLLEEELLKLPAVQQELVDIQRNYALRENLYTFLLQKRAEAGISRASTTSDIVVVNPPVAGGAITPKVMQNYGTAGLMGLLIPVLFFVLKELLNRKIQAKEDIEKYVTLPIIGGIGHNDAVSNLVVYRRPRSGVAESFRALRSNLNYYTEGKDKKMFVITSSLSGEGKTFTTINLATIFAFSEKRTVIIGADMRRPRLFDDFGLKNDIGLSQYLSGQQPLEAVIQVTDISQLDLISAGPVPPNPSELLMHERFDIMLDTLFRTYDFIIVDSPPLALVADAFVLSKRADHTLYVVRQNSTPMEALTNVQEVYESGKIKNISIVFNDIRKSSMGYGYGSGYGYGYGYGYGEGKSKRGYGYYDEG